MRKNRTFNKTTHKMVRSYMIITVILVFVLGIVTSLVFSNIFRREIANLNVKMMEQAKEMIVVDLFNSTEKATVDAGNAIMETKEAMNLFYEPESKDFSEVYALYDLINQEYGSHTTYIDSMNLYLKQKDMCISSKYGYKDFKSGDEYGLKAMFDDFDYPDTSQGFWVLDTYNSSAKGRYIPELVPADYVYYAVKLVNNKADRDVDVALISAVSKDIIYENLGKIFPNGPNQIYLIRKDVNLVSFPNEGDFSALQAAGIIDKVCAAYDDSGSINASVDGKKSIIFYSKLGFSDCIIINIIPNSYFYQKQLTMLYFIASLVLIAISFGYIFAKYTVKRMYNPLRLLTRRAAGVIGEQYAGAKEYNSEYSIIDSAINKLTTRIDDMQEKIIKNRPVISHQIVTSIIYSDIDETSCRDRLALIRPESLNKKYTSYCSMIVQIKISAFNEMDITYRESLVYEIIEYIESLSTEQHLIICARRSERDITALCLSNENAKDVLCLCAADLLEHINENFHMGIFAAIGEPVDSIIDMAQSYSDAKMIMLYFFYCYDSFPLSGEELKKREDNEISIPPAYRMNIYKALKDNDDKKLEMAINEFVRICKTNYSAASCQYELYNIIIEFDRFAQENGFSSRSSSCMHHALEQCDDVIMFMSYMYKYAVELFEDIRNKRDSKNYRVVEVITEYIQQNYHKDISLDLIGELVGMAPKYASKLFKEQTNSGVLEYINHVRLKNASDMLLESNLSINSIAAKSGYGTVAYFIKRFKREYGITPNRYRIENKIKPINP